MTSGSCILQRLSIPALALATFGLTAARAEAANLDQSFPPAGIARIAVDLPMVDSLTLERSSGAVHVTVTGDGAPECQTTLTRAGDTLRLAGVRQHHVLHDGHDCDLVVHVAAPPSAALDVELGAGAVELVTLGSPLELSVGAGDIAGSLSANARVKTGAGRVHLRDLTGPVEVKTGVGDIDLAFTAAPAGDIRAATGLGTIDLELPAGTAVHARLATGLGSVHNDLREQDDAPTRVRASTGLGTIAVSAR